MYGTGLGLPATGATGGLLVMGITIGSGVLALVALLMLILLVISLVRAVRRREPNERP